MTDRQAPKDGLPARRLDARMLKVWYTTSACLIAVTLLIAAVVLFVSERVDGPTMVFAAIVAVVLLIELGDALISPRVEYATWRFDVTPTDIDLYHGVFVKRRIVVPLIRVQHVETAQGPILSRYGLATVKVQTAGQSFEIPGLDQVEADEFRDRLAQLVREAKEDM